MVAVVIQNSTFRKIIKTIPEQNGKLCIISVGKHVKSYQLKRNLQVFGNDYLIAKNLEFKELKPFDTSSFRKEMLFRAFYKCVTSTNGQSLKIGIVPDDCVSPKQLLPLISHSAETVILSHNDLDEFCKFCLSSIGVCPDIVNDTRDLSDCDIAFAPGGLTNFSGKVFGVGGITPEDLAFELPKYCDSAILGGIYPVDLASLLSVEEPYLLDETPSLSIFA